ncbi:purine-cytosine permease-like protein [Caballeronia udeis]|uniref:Purine-cytosine permease-like protein n=1 Tax=Caballeronia udeis TaxID=1232866 RepID=A0ABW8MLN6_9BURK
MDEFVNTVMDIVGAASRLTLHSSAIDLINVLVGLGGLALVAIILLINESKSPDKNRERTPDHHRHWWMHHRH